MKPLQSFQEEDLQLQDYNELDELKNMEVSHNMDETNDQLYYKFNSPMHPIEVDWTITLSRNDFPWQEIRFGDFTSKDCYDKYASIVKDS